MINFRDSFWGPNGFEELKKYMKLGNDFCRELVSVLAERSEAELQYSKNLNRIGQRLQKLSKDYIGGLANAWFQVSLQFDSEAEMHKTFSNLINDDLIKPLKIFIENQSKARKPIETHVEKAIRVLNERRAKDYKYRSRCFKTIKEIENTMYSLDEAQKGVAGKPPKQKEIQRITDNLKHLQPLLEKSEIKYHKACGSVELARQDWQMAMLRGCNQLQSIDEQRISQVSILLQRYTNQVGEMSKKAAKMFDSLQKIDINVQDDIELASKKYGTGSNIHEICLFDVYAENTKNMMNRERRIANLSKWSTLLTTDIQAQIKCAEGLDKVKNFHKENPKFANNEEDMKQKQNSIELLQMLYEASVFKINTALAELLDAPKPTFKYSSNINLLYDKFGVPISVLKLPIIKDASAPPIQTLNTFEANIQMPQPIISSQTQSKSLNLYKDVNPPSYRTVSASLPFTNKRSNTMLSIDSDDDEWNEVSWIGKCIAQYDYKGERDDELTLKLGDIIKIFEKRADGWWRGDLNGLIGLFPSTYVKEIESF